MESEHLLGPPIEKLAHRVPEEAPFIYYGHPYEEGIAGAARYFHCRLLSCCSEKNNEELPCELQIGSSLWECLTDGCQNSGIHSLAELCNILKHGDSAVGQKLTESRRKEIAGDMWDMIHNM